VEAVFCRISELTSQYEQHPFFQLLDGPGSPPEVRAMVPALTFFVFAFQDILRLNEQHMADPELKTIARQHRAEDAGHQNWFLHDARRLGVEPGVEWTFGREHRATRDASYRLISEVFRASDDRVRVVMPIVLEAAGHPFFSRVFRFFERSGISAPLKYFAEAHWQVEEGHQMLQDSQSTVLRQLALPEHLRVECFSMIERMFDAIVGMIGDVHARMERSRMEHSGYPSAALELLAGAG
jgi:hypothetical protein